MKEKKKNPALRKKMARSTAATPEMAAVSRARRAERVLEDVAAVEREHGDREEAPPHVDRDEHFPSHQQHGREGVERRGVAEHEVQEPGDEEAGEGACQADQHVLENARRAGSERQVVVPPIIIALIVSFTSCETEL